jgi:hypothetical protein
MEEVMKGVWAVHINAVSTRQVRPLRPARLRSQMVHSQAQWVDARLRTICPVADASNAKVFSMNVGTLPGFHFGDTAIQGGPAIRYKADGTFNGMFFDEYFRSPARILN